MNLLRQFTICFLAAFILESCEKAAAPIPSVSLNVINTSPGVPNAKVSTPATGYYSQIIGVNAGSNFVFTLPVGSPSITITDGLDSVKPLYTNKIAGDIYSLYVTGQGGNDIILNKESIPAHVDSSVGIRFANLSPGSDPISINIKDRANGSEVSSLVYKGISDFKDYTAVIPFSSSGYAFEFRDAATGDSLTTYNTGVLPVFKNLTVILYGDPGSQRTMRVNNY